jgi:hypothetical protein
MNIYKARKLQALLFKRSGADFKRMRAFVCDGKLYYVTLHLAYRGPSVVISENIMNVVRNNISVGIETSIEFISKEINPRVPEGMYVVEYIEID